MIKKIVIETEDGVQVLVPRFGQGTCTTADCAVPADAPVAEVVPEAVPEVEAAPEPAPETEAVAPEEAPAAEVPPAPVEDASVPH